MKYAWIDGQRECYPVAAMCRALAVSASGLATWKRGGQVRTRLAEAALLALIRAIHAESKRAYGWPRVWKELQDRGLPAGKERVRRLMQENGIRAKHKRRYQATTDSKHDLPVAPNLLNRQFETAAPDQVWTADITYSTPSHQRSPPGRELRCLSMTGMQIHGVNVEPDLLLLREEVSRSGGDGSDTDPVTKSADNGVCGEVVTPR